MASIVVRNLDEHVKQAIAERARLKGHSMEAEAREILSRAATPTNPLEQLHELVAEASAFVDLSLPERTVEERDLNLP